MTRIKGIQDRVESTMLELLQEDLAKYRSLWADSDKENRELKDKVKYLEQIIAKQRIANAELHKTCDRHAAVMKFVYDQENKYFSLANKYFSLAQQAEEEDGMNGRAYNYYEARELFYSIREFDCAWRQDHE